MTGAAPEDRNRRAERISGQRVRTRVGEIDFRARRFRTTALVKRGHVGGPLKSTFAPIAIVCTEPSHRPLPLFLVPVQTSGRFR